ncbi:MAG: hypothetical protein LBF60_02315 [Treponema sp.]|jgi:glucosamine--fructose-6-phosphate aminotransferase (isomerizing)|nr:hypothetical protein [Treponema sp.]
MSVVVSLVPFWFYIDAQGKLFRDKPLCAAVQLALGQVIGAHTIAVMEKRQPNRLIAARKSSPLALGVG